MGAGLEGRGVIVTGAARGIGKAVAEAFAVAGAKVMAADMDGEALAKVTAGLGGTGHVATVIDLRDLDAQREMVARARRELGNLYALAHVAGVLQRRPSLNDITEDDWDRQIDVNLKATFFAGRRPRR